MNIDTDNSRLAGRRGILARITEEQQHRRRVQRKYRNIVAAIISGTARPEAVIWWNEMCRESRLQARSDVMRKLFGKVRFSDVGNLCPPLVECFRSVEKRILDKVQQDKNNVLIKKYRGGDTMGISLGSTFVGGHKKVYTRSPFQVANPELIDELKEVVSVMFDTSFGNEDWYITLKKNQTMCVEHAWCRRVELSVCWTADHVRLALVVAGKQPASHRCGQRSGNFRHDLYELCWWRLGGYVTSRRQST